MFSNYREILKYPGAARFSIAAAIARFPMSMQGIAILLMISTLLGKYGVAGQVNASFVIAYAVASPVLARVIDRYGQARVMRPALAICIVDMLILLYSILYLWPEWTWYLFAIIAGLTAGSFGALVRSRWTHLLGHDPKLLNSAYALEAALDEVIWVLGPMIATVLVVSVHASAGLTLCILCMSIGGFWFLGQKATEPRPRTKSELLAELGDAGTKSLLRSGALVVLFIVCMMCGLTFGVLDLTTIAFAEYHGVKDWGGPLLAILSVGSFAGAIVYGSRQWPTSPLRLFVGGIAVMALGFSTFYFANTFGVLIVCLIVTGISYAPTMTNATNILHIVVEPARFTEGMAWINTAFTVGISLGSSIGGNVVDHYGPHGGFTMVLITGWLMLLAVTIGALPLRSSLQKAQKKRLVKMDLQREIEMRQALKLTPPAEQVAADGVSDSQLQPDSDPNCTKA